MMTKRQLLAAWGISLLVMLLAACSNAASLDAGGDRVSRADQPVTEGARQGSGDREGWKEFCQTEIGCTLLYPEDAHFEEGANKFGVHTMRIQFDLPDSEGYQGMVVRSLPVKTDEDLEEVLRQLHQSAPERISFEEWRDRLEEITVNGRPALRTFCSVEGGDFSVVIPHERRVYVATPTHSLVSVCADSAAVDLFFDVLETLTLE